MTTTSRAANDNKIVTKGVLAFHIMLKLGIRVKNIVGSYWGTFTGGTSIMGTANNNCILIDSLKESKRFIEAYRMYRHDFITMTSYWARLRVKSPASRLFTQPFIQGADQRKHQRSVSLAFVETFSAVLAFCARNYRWPVNSPHKGQWHGTLMFSLICAWTDNWADNEDAGDLRRHHAHYDVIVMNHPYYHRWGNAWCKYWSPNKIDLNVYIWCFKIHFDWQHT